MDATTWLHRVSELAENSGISYGEAERRLEAMEPKKRIRRTRPSRPSVPRAKLAPCYRYSKVISMAKSAGKSYVVDTEELDYIEDAAYDIADCLLYDPMLMESMTRNYRRVHCMHPSRQTLKEILADYVHDGMTSRRVKL